MRGRLQLRRRYQGGGSFDASSPGGLSVFESQVWLF